MQITKILNEAFSNYQKDKELYKLQLVVYAQGFPNFVLPFFGAPSLIRVKSKTKFRTVSMGGVKKQTRTTMEVDSIIIEVVIEST
jgi:hypothetical protein